MIQNAQILMDKIILFANDIFDPNFQHRNFSSDKHTYRRDFMIITNTYDNV